MRAPAIDRVMSCRKRLAEHLSTEYLCTTDIAALPTEEIVLDALEFQELDQVTENRVHGVERLLLRNRFTAIDNDARAANED
jgi:hypothetical protein